MTSAIDSLSALTSISGASGPAAASGADPTQMGTSAPDGAGDRFRAALDEARLVPQQESHLQGPSSVSQAILTQDDTFNALTQKVDAFSASSGQMSMQEVTAQSIELQHEIAHEMIKIYVGTAVAQGGRGTVQTLMKNQ